jgi:hypothetical protein
VKDENAQRLFIACGYCAPNTLIPASILEAAVGEGSELCDEWALVHERFDKRGVSM